MLDEFFAWVLSSLFGLDLSLRWVESLHFFIYDSVKILLLLFVMIFLISILRTYLPEDKIKVWANKKYGVSYLFASLFGAVTPFCSCSSIPIFLSLLKSGVPLGVAFSFLVTSPLINEYLVVLMVAFLGWKIALLYVLFGIIIGVFSGFVLSKMNLEKYLVKDFVGVKGKRLNEKKKSLKDRFLFGLDEAVVIIKKLWLWILLGVGIGALIHNYIPSDVIQSIVGGVGFWAIPLVVLLGIPMYGNSVAILPIILVLFEKGVSLGVILSFMMSIVALSLPEAIILRRVMRLKLILIFFGIVALGIMIIGYLFYLF